VTDERVGDLAQVLRQLDCAGHPVERVLVRAGDSADEVVEAKWRDGCCSHLVNLRLTRTVVNYWLTGPQSEARETIGLRDA